MMRVAERQQSDDNIAYLLYLLECLAIVHLQVQHTSSYVGVGTKL